MTRTPCLPALTLPSSLKSSFGRSETAHIDPLRTKLQSKLAGALKCSRCAREYIHWGFSLNELRAREWLDGPEEPKRWFPTKRVPSRLKLSVNAAPWVPALGDGCPCPRCWPVTAEKRLRRVAARRGSLALLGPPPVQVLSPMCGPFQGTREGWGVQEQTLVQGSGLLTPQQSGYSLSVCGFLF